MILVSFLFAFVSVIASSLAEGSQGAKWPRSNSLPVELTGHEGCSTSQQGAMMEGFQEMNNLFSAAYPIDWVTRSAVDFSGQAERVAPYKEMVEQDLLKSHKYSYTTQEQIRNSNIHVRCDDPYRLCSTCTVGQGRCFAYNIGNQPHINFCSGYFGPSELHARAEKMMSNETLKGDIEAYYNRATAWARRVLHPSEIGAAFHKIRMVKRTGIPTIYSSQTFMIPMGNSLLTGVEAVPRHSLKCAYGAVRAIWLAALSMQEAYDTPNNAEKYALYVHARYIEKAGKFHPKKPVVDLTSQSALLEDVKLQDSANPKYGCFNQTDVVTASIRSEDSGAETGSAKLTLGKNSGQALFALVGALMYCVMMPLLS